MNHVTSSFHLLMFLLTLLSCLRRDHAGGNSDLVKMVPEKLQVRGGDPRINEINHSVKHNEEFKVTIQLLLFPLYMF